VTDSHIFICFSSKDEAVAREVVDFLETDGLKCWISLRDVLPGHNYQEAIVQAIEGAVGIVFLFSESSNKSGEIKKELSIGGGINKPVFPLRLAPILPSGALRYELATRQWIDLFPHRREALAKLASTVKAVIAGSTAGEPDGMHDRPLESLREAKPASVERAAQGSRTPIVAPGSQQFEAIRALLARHIGPIAKVFVEKAANEALTANEFSDKLAAHVAVPADRAAFVKAVREQLAAKS
jgi:hypothetical protein